MNKGIVKVVLAFVAIGLAMVACVPVSTPLPTFAPTLAPADVPTSTPIPTWTLTPTPTSTSVPTPTPIPTSTPIPTPTSTFPPIPTSVPIPTRPAETGAVHAVLFYSPTCPYCRTVREEVLPPLQETYGSQLQIAEIDVSTPEGSTLYHAAVYYFGIPSERYGVPTMVIGDTVLVGSQEISMYLPGLIEAGLAEGGVGWPAIPGFEPPAF